MGTTAAEIAGAAVSHVPAVIGTVGGSVGLVLGWLKLREVMQDPELDIRWNWKWENDALSEVGFYFMNKTTKPVHVEHVAFRVLDADGETWRFVGPPADFEQRFPFTVPAASVSEMARFSAADAAVWDVFASGRRAILFVDFNGERKEFTVPGEMRLMPQEGIRYEL